jgi:Flagellar biosynthesis protein, FliO
MFDQLSEVDASRFLIAAAIVGLCLVVLAIVFWFLKNRPSSPFVRGGRNRQPRLAVMDAAPVDVRRRLILVRRDNVEHLIMIGGPTDVVIESGIAVSMPKGDETLATLSSVAITTEQPVLQPRVLRPSTPEEPVRREEKPQADPRARASLVAAVAELDSRNGNEAQTLPPMPAPARPDPRNIPMPMAEPVSAGIRPAPVSPPSPPPVSAATASFSPPPVSLRPSAQSPAQSVAAPAQPAPPVMSPAFDPEPETKSSPLETAFAADILDAARDRVLRHMEPKLNDPAAYDAIMADPFAPPAPAVQSERSDAPVSDFERVLEKQGEQMVMEGTLDVAAIRPEPAKKPRDFIDAGLDGPRRQPISGASLEVSLEHEMARVLGEFSLNKKD